MLGVSSCTSLTVCNPGLTSCYHLRKPIEQHMILIITDWLLPHVQKEEATYHSMRKLIQACNYKVT